MFGDQQAVESDGGGDEDNNSQPQLFNKKKERKNQFWLSFIFPRGSFSGDVLKGGDSRWQSGGCTLRRRILSGCP